jgi:hypothetical protein
MTLLDFYFWEVIKKTKTNGAKTAGIYTPINVMVYKRLPCAEMLSIVDDFQVCRKC